MQLFCLTYAGGTAAFYNQMDQYIVDDIELVKLEYAGHGDRRKEVFYKDFSELADDLYAEVKRCLKSDEKYALIGYSMGSISVVEVLKNIIEKEEIKLPEHIFLAAHEPIVEKELARISREATDEFVKERTIRFGGIPDKLVNNKSFWRMYLPIYKNDYSIIGKYDFDLLELKTEIPTTVFYSSTDTLLSNMKLWGKYFIGELEFIEYTGTHFFIFDHCEEMCSIINNRLRLEENKNDI